MLTYFDEHNHKVGEAVDVGSDLSMAFVAKNMPMSIPKFALYISKDGIEFHLYRIKYSLGSFSVEYVD